MVPLHDFQSCFFFFNLSEGLTFQCVLADSQTLVWSDKAIVSKGWRNSSWIQSNSMYFLLVARSLNWSSYRSVEASRALSQEQLCPLLISLHTEITGVLWDLSRAFQLIRLFHSYQLCPHSLRYDNLLFMEFFYSSSTYWKCWIEENIP